MLHWRAQVVIVDMPVQRMERHMGVVDMGYDSRLVGKVGLVGLLGLQVLVELGVGGMKGRVDIEGLEMEMEMEMGMGVELHAVVVDMQGQHAIVDTTVGVQQQQKERRLVVVVDMLVVVVVFVLLDTVDIAGVAVLDIGLVELVEVVGNMLAGRMGRGSASVQLLVLELVLVRVWVWVAGL